MQPVIDFIRAHWAELLLALIGLIAGGLVIKRWSNRQSGSSTYADQSGAQAQGDIVGRDKIIGQGKDRRR